jgi:hypothetical protein
MNLNGRCIAFLPPAGGAPRLGASGAPQPVGGAGGRAWDAPGAARGRRQGQRVGFAGGSAGGRRQGPRRWEAPGAAPVGIAPRLARCGVGRCKKNGLQGFRLPSSG